MPLQQGAVFETGGDDCEAAGDGRGHVEAAAGTLAAAIVSVTAGNGIAAAQVFEK